MADLLNVTDETFETEVLKAESPVLVDFWAEWCGPCKRLMPAVEELASELAGKVKIVKCDVDRARQTASRYGIFSIPTLLLFVQGEVKEQIQHPNGKQAILSRLQGYLQ